MPDFQGVEFPSDVEEAASPYWQLTSNAESDDLARDLTPDTEAEANGVFRLRSKKLMNILFNWKEFIFNIAPISTGAIYTLTQNTILGCILGIRAIYIGAGLRDIVIDKDVSIIALKIHELSWDSENNNYGFVSVNEIKEACPDIEDFDNKLVTLFDLGIAGLDTRGTHVVMYEKVILSS